jgi:hypothetical protein
MPFVMDVGGGRASSGKRPSVSGFKSIRAVAAMSAEVFRLRRLRRPPDHLAVSILTFERPCQFRANLPSPPNLLLHTHDQGEPECRGLCRPTCNRTSSRIFFLGQGCARKLVLPLVRRSNTAPFSLFDGSFFARSQNSLHELQAAMKRSSRCIGSEVSARLVITSPCWLQGQC